MRFGVSRLRRGAHWTLVAVMVSMLLRAGPVVAQEQEEPPSTRPAHFEWTQQRDELLLSMSFRDVVDARIRRKLSRGLPTTIVLTAALYRPGTEEPLATTAQTCKVTWHVWHEAYRVQTTRPSGSRTRWTTTLEGVLRRCAETHGLLVATNEQVPTDAPVYLRGRIQINPVSPELLKKIKRWVSRPVRTGTAAPGDALFSTFTGLFMRRIGEAEKTLHFVTPATQPTIPPKEEPKEETRNEG